MYEKILDDISAIVDIDQQSVGYDYLRHLARNMAKTLGIKFVLIGRPTPPENDAIQTVVVWAGDDFADNITYELKGTPCKEVYTGNRVCIHDRNVATLFPDDVLLAQMGVEAYVGAPVIAPNGDLLGLLVLLDDKPIEDHAYFSALVEFGAGRIGAELERHIFHEEEAAFHQALEHSEQRFSAIFDQTYQYVTILDTDGRVLEANRSALEVVGTTEEAVIGRMVWETPWWSHDDRLSARVKEAVGIAVNGVMQQFEARHPLLDGSYVDVDVTLKPFVDDGGQVRLLIVEAHDVTSIKKLEKKLIHSQKMEAVGTLAGGIAHDFNNILGGVLGYSELSLMEEGVSEQLRHNLNGILTACLRGRDLVAKMLTFSRQEAQEKRPIKITGVVEESINLARASIPASVEITRDLRVNQGHIMGDPTQIQQILLNLCTNAFHAIGDDTGTIIIGTRETWLGKETAEELGTAPGTHLALSVTDSGCGIPEALLPRIFDPFFTTKEVGKGTGLGLSVVHGIVESFGGAITVDSHEGEGTTFTIFFPLIEGSVTAEIGEGGGSVDEKAVQHSRGKVMLVEDEPNLLEIGRVMLEKMGYQVAAFDDPLKAWANIEAAPEEYDVVITDLSMPRLRGRELAERIKSIAPEMSIIAWTGYSDTTTSDTAIQMGFDGFLQKPARYEELDAMLKKLLE